MSKPKHFIDRRPYGDRPDMFEPNNQPNHNGLGRPTREDPTIAWIFLAIIVLVALVAMS